MSEFYKDKVFYVTTIPESLNFFQGQLLALSKEYNVTVISSDNNKLHKIAEQESVNAFYIPMQREISLFKDIWSLMLFIRFFIKERPSMVHGNTPKGSFLSMIAAYITKVPIRIYMCHGLRYQGCQGFKRKLLMLMEKISCFCATHVICVSNGVMDTLKEDRICDLKMEVVGFGSANGIDTKYFCPDNYVNKQQIKDIYKIEKDNFVYIYVGRIVRDKGIDELLCAFEKLNIEHKNTKLIMVGSEEDTSNKISVYSKELLKHPNVICVGKQHDIRPFLAMSNVLVLPSYREGFGIVLIEAGAMGVPVISSDIIGCRDTVVCNETGIFVQPANVDDLYDKMVKIYKDDNLYESIQKQCRGSVVKRFDRDQVQKRYISLYATLISKLS